ncbi:uncharacterized protein LOC125011393 isoform X3 [Mugil cephalus]|uniref:uncharacterized protein LOC125011393 isoform X3 n=1 Tax=Mugil cephalus TaxID=48193 RepID=UPI001FB729C0|nr:uncharacterized protein LOC125011393 isoform X3 [Mugil cephalus]
MEIKKNYDEKTEDEMKKNVKKTEKLMAEIYAPFSHVVPVQRPPPYKKEMELREVYPQLPVISQEGNYHIKNEAEQVIEVGKAETTIRMYPSTKSKKQTTHLETGGRLRIKRMDFGEVEDQSDEEEAMGGYDPAVRRLLARAERRGGKTGRRMELRDDSEVENESENDDSDEDLERESPTLLKSAKIKTAYREEERRQILREVEENIDRCCRCLDKCTTPKGRKALEDQLQELQIQKKELRKTGSQQLDKEYELRSRKEKKPGKMCPVVIRGQNLEYKPWQSTDISDILEKLPTLQDGAHPWISKLEEIMVGTQAAVGDIKRLLANILGVPAMGEILQRAGLNCYVETAVNDSELLANRGRVWRALKDTFPTNIHPDNILIEPLGQEENPRAYVLRAYQVWRNVTGNDPEESQMEQSILGAKIQKGLPLPVRSKLAEVVGLGNMAKSVYTDHVAHQVDLYRKKEYDQKEQDQETLRKLNQIQLVDNKKKDF